MDAPADVTTGAPGDPAAADAELIDDSPEKVKADLRKFNRAAAEVAKVLTPLKLILKISDLTGVDSAMEHMKKAGAVEKVIEKKRKELVRPWNDEVDRINAHAKSLVKDVPGEILRVKNLMLDFQKSEEVRIAKERTTTRDKFLLELGFVHMAAGTPEILATHYKDSSSDVLVYRADLETVSDIVWREMLQRIEEAREEERKKAAAALQVTKEAASFFDEEDPILTSEPAAVASPTRPIASSWVGWTATTKVAGATKTWAFEITDQASIPREYLQVDETKIREAVRTGIRAIAGVRIFQKDSISLR